LSYTCHYCQAETDSAEAHGITVYDKNGVEERMEVLCDACYKEWLASLKG
jgi:protein-disulfide isomerase